MAESGRRIAKHYELGAQLGAGRAGRVFAARDLRTGADVAIKLRDSDDDSPLDVESAGLRQLEHPNLLRILDAGSDGGRRFIVTELLREGALDALPKPLAPESLHALASQMLDALAFLHAHGILHGDIKTENVLIAGLTPPHFKLSDFGLAQRRVDLAAGTTRGSPAFMPPEIIRGEPADERSDLYALGITLYECAFGELPFDNADVRTVLMRHLTEVPARLQDPGDVDPQLVRLLRRLLAKEPAQRPADARAALAVWRGDAAAAPRWVPPRLGVLIGRDAELATLEEAFAGETAAIGIEGPSGLGKTRLLRELALRMELRGIRVATWTPQGLEGIDTARDPSEPAESEAGLADLGPKSLAELRARTVLQQLVQQPWLLVVDDVDSAPQWFLDAISSLIREVSSTSRAERLICISGRERSVEIVRDALEAGGFAIPLSVALKPWPLETLETAASALLGARRLHSSLLDVLIIATAGVPAEVESACHQLAEKNLLRLDTHGLLTVAVETTAESLLDPLNMRAAAQLARCNANEVELLRLLAILQAPAPIPFLEMLDSSFTQGWIDLHRKGLTAVLQGAIARITFAHEGIRAASLESLPPGERRRFHDRVAEVLDREPDSAPQEILALHRASGSDLRAARSAVALVASASETELRPELLERAYAALLDLWPPSHDRSDRRRTALAFLDTKLRLGLYEEVRNDVAKLKENDGLDTSKWQAVLNREAQALVFLGKSELAMELLDDDAEGLSGIESRVLRAQILSEWGRHEEVLEVCDSIPLESIPRLMASTLVDLRSASFNALGRAGDATLLLREYIPKFEAEGAVQSAATLMLRLSRIEFYQGKMGDAEAVMDRALMACQAVGDRRGLLRALNNLAAVYAETGRYAKASEQLRAALDLCRRLGESDSLSYVLANLAQHLLMLGRYTEALEHVDEAIAIGLRRNLALSLIHSRIVRGGILTVLGLDELCQSELSATRDLVRGQLYEGQILLLWSDLALRRNNPTAIPSWLDLARQVISDAGADDELVRLDLIEARLLWLKGDQEQALEIAEKASSKSKSLNTLALAVEADTLWAELSTEIASSRALEIAEAALETAVTVGLPESIWRLRRVIGRIAFLEGDYLRALSAYRTCIHGIQEICENVPPPYLDSYLEHPDRLKVFEESAVIRQTSDPHQ